MPHGNVCFVLLAFIQFGRMRLERAQWVKKKKKKNCPANLTTGVQIPRTGIYAQLSYDGARDEDKRRPTSSRVRQTAQQQE